MSCAHTFTRTRETRFYAEKRGWAFTIYRQFICTRCKRPDWRRVKSYEEDGL